MNTLTKNEIITLKHLADGQQHNDAPSTLSEAQFYVALKSLQTKGLVLAAFCEGEEVEASQIKKSGQAVLDDMKSVERRILRHLVTAEGLTQDQFDLLQYMKKTGEFENIFDISWYNFKNQVWAELCANKLLQSGDGNFLVLTRLGVQTVERIEEELYSLLSDDREEEEQMQSDQPREAAVESHEVKDSGFRIKEERITDVIKTIWSMHDVGMFVDKNGDKPSVKSLMDAFAVFLHAKQLEQYSTYMNKALKATKNTYLDVFYKMEDSAEKHYDNQKSRKIDK